MPRRTSDTNKTPSTLPTSISAVDFQYAVPGEKSSHEREITNAGIVKIAPAATDSPIDPAVRAMFSSRIEPLKIRSTAMPITAAGYVAAIVCPARSPRYAFAAPRITHITRPNSTARRVNSLICTFGGTNGLCSLTRVSLSLFR
jgi:hypothetical protein